MELKKGKAWRYLPFLSFNYLSKALHTKKRKTKREGWEVAITTAFADGGMGGEEAFRTTTKCCFLLPTV
jgi:hypothetical protein